MVSAEKALKRRKRKDRALRHHLVEQTNKQAAGHNIWKMTDFKNNVSYSFGFGFALHTFLKYSPSPRAIRKKEKLASKNFAS